MTTIAKPLIVFDMDGVLIDVSRSYREAVRQTVEAFFNGAVGWEELPRPIFRLSDIADVKERGGLNNDWDLTRCILSLLMSLVETSTEARASGSDPWRSYRNQVRSWDVSGLGPFLRHTERPLLHLMERSGEGSDPIVAGLYRGDVGSGNIIKQIFQEIYLGHRLFSDTYHLPAALPQSEGLIHRESLLIGTGVLDHLSENGTLAIATGRPGTEAAFTLNRFRITGYFSAVYTLDECLREEQQRTQQGKIGISLGKPDPFMLDAISEGTETYGDCYYIGDMPDDMVAASRAKAPFQGIGLLTSAPEKDRLRERLSQAGAKYVIDTVEELTPLLETSWKESPI